MAEKRSHVPKFGNWEGKKDVPYTAYFDNARKSRNGTKMINPNDPEENQNLSIDLENDHYNAGNNSGGHGSHGIGYAGNQRRPLRQTIGYEYSAEYAPVHHQGKTIGRDNPLSEGYNVNDIKHGTPGRFRLNRGDETPEKGAAIPEFGKWDVNNPKANEYSLIFNQARQERQGGAGNNLATHNERQQAIRKQHSDAKSRCFCFAWSKKL